MVRLDVEATLYFFTKGLHNLILTKISNIVLAKTLTTGEIGGGKKLQENSRSIDIEILFFLPRERKRWRRISFGSILMVLKKSQISPTNDDSKTERDEEVNRHSMNQPKNRRENDQYQWNMILF